MENIYRHLQRKLNTVGTVVPEVKNDTDIAVLKHIYTEEQAKFALNMPIDLSSIDEIATLTETTPEYAEGMLNQMVKSGAVYRVNDEGITKYFLNAAYHGFIEFNAYNLTPDMAVDFAKYFVKGLKRVFTSVEHPFFTYKPVNPALVENNGCLETDNYEYYIRNHSLFALTKCFCRTQADVHPKTESCKSDPSDNLEMCLVVGELAEYYLSEGWGREITMEEALEHMRKCDENGHCIEIFNSLESNAICSCCECCCGGIAGYKAFDGIGKKFLSNYRRELDDSLCIHCGKCYERCNLDAISIENGKVVFDPNKCWGCGLCVSTCPTKASKLFRKPDDELVIPTAKRAFPDLMVQVRECRKDSAHI